MDKGEAIKFLEKLVSEHPDKGEKRYYIGGKNMSAQDLLKEVRSNSKIGQEYLDVIIETAEKIDR